MMFTGALTLAAKKKSVAPSQTMAVEKFSKIELGVGINATYTQGAFAPLKFIGDPESLNDIMVTSRKGELEIRFRNNSHQNRRNRNIQVIIQAPEITSFDILTGAVINIPGGMTTQKSVSFDLSTGAVATIGSLTAANVEFDMSTGAVINATDIKAKNVDVDASTGAVATLSGTCTHAELDASTGAIINAGKLVARVAEVSASVGAQVDYNAQTTTEVSKSLGAQVTNHAR